MLCYKHVWMSSPLKCSVKQAAQGGGEQEGEEITGTRAWGQKMQKEHKRHMDTWLCNLSANSIQFWE